MVKVFQLMFFKSGSQIHTLKHEMQSRWRSLNRLGWVLRSHCSLKRFSMLKLKCNEHLHTDIWSDREWRKLHNGVLHVCNLQILLCGWLKDFCLLSTEKLCFNTTNLAGIFASFCVASADEGWCDRLEVCSVTVVIAPHWQLGLALHCALFATCGRDRDHCGKVQQGTGSGTMWERCWHKTYQQPQIRWDFMFSQ
jgi:hypothetical protein